MNNVHSCGCMSPVGVVLNRCCISRVVFSNVRFLREFVGGGVSLHVEDGRALYVPITRKSFEEDLAKFATFGVEFSDEARDRILHEIGIHGVARVI